MSCAGGKRKAAAPQREESEAPAQHFPDTQQASQAAAGPGARARATKASIVEVRWAAHNGGGQGRWEAASGQRRPCPSPRMPPPSEHSFHPSTTRPPTLRSPSTRPPSARGGAPPRRRPRLRPPPARAAAAPAAPSEGAAGARDLPACRHHSIPLPHLIQHLLCIPDALVFTLSVCLRQSGAASPGRRGRRCGYRGFQRSSMSP